GPRSASPCPSRPGSRSPRPRSTCPCSTLLSPSRSRAPSPSSSAWSPPAAPHPSIPWRPFAMSERRSAPRRLARRRAAAMPLVLAALRAAPPPVRAQEPEPLTVERAVALAIARAPGLAAAVAAEDEAKATARASEDAFRPEAWVATVPGWGEGLPASIAGRLPAAASAEARYPLYDPGRRADVFEARARRSLARAGAAAAP